MDGDPDSYPTKNEIADYLERYAQQIRIPVALGEGITRLEQAGYTFLAITTRGSASPHVQP